MKIISIIVLAGLIYPSFSIAQKRDTAGQWYQQLPACPCKDPDFTSVKLNDGWAKDKGNLNKYHKGAVSSYRSYPFVKTAAGKSGQQCCYDKNGDLITKGRGAGTPDKSSTCKGEDKNGIMITRVAGLWNHYWKDVRPWSKLMKADSTTGWSKYNELWVPDRGKSCLPNGF